MPQIGGGAAQQPDLMGNLIQLMQITQQRNYQQAQVALQRDQQAQAGLQLLGVLMQNTPNPSELQPFIKELAPRIGVSEQSLLNLAANISPSESAVRGGAARAGRTAQTPEQQQDTNAEALSQVATGQSGISAAMSQFLTDQLGMQQKVPQVANMLGQAGLVRQFSGLTPGAFSIDQAVHNMQPEEINTAARMSAGLQPNAAAQLGAQVEMRGQDMGYSTSMAGNRLGWAQLAQQGQLGMLGLQMQRYLGEVSASGRSSLGIGDVPELVKVQQSLVTNLQQAGTPAARQQYLNSLGTINSLLNSLGVPTPQVNPSADVNQFNSFNGADILHPIENGVFGSRRTLPMFNPQMQQGAQQFFGGIPFPYTLQQPGGSR